MKLKSYEHLGYLSPSEIVEISERNHEAVKNYFVRLNGLRQEVADFEQKYRLNSILLPYAIHIGHVPHNDEISRWLTAVQTLEAEARWQDKVSE